MTEDTNKQPPVLKVRDLRVYYETPKGDVLAVDGINFDLFKGETLGLVGESGCGKSTAAMGILQLVVPPGRIAGGEVLLEGNNILGLSDQALRGVRWIKLALIPQGAMNSLNPTMKVSDQISDVILAHEGRKSKKDLKERVLELLSMVGLPGRVYDLYPHELSGGMKQRVCIAMAIALNPTIIIADESTSALDVVVQRVVAQTMLKVKQALGVSMIMIGHDMGLMAQMVDRVAVMYAGKIVEIAPVKDIFANPKHPYSQVLIESVPSLKERKPLKITEGITHDPRNPPPGCIFQLRCPFVMDVCRSVAPPMQEIKPGQQVACHLYQPSEDGSFINVADVVEIRNATKLYKQRRVGGVNKEVVALQNFNLSIPKQPASIITIAGESGSGKTTLAQLVLGFTHLTSGQIIFDGQDISTSNSKQMKEYRRHVQAVFQDPFGVYNPFYRVEHVFNMVINNFQLSNSQSTSRELMERALNIVGLRGEDVLRKYPHQLSGGQRQRIMMARAYMVSPKLIVADEPVSMVDASLRASILDVMIRLKEEVGISFLYITHDLSTAYQIGDQIYILYQGAIAEKGNTINVIDSPQHPYVQQLVDSVPVPDPDIKWKGEIVLPPEEEMRTSVHTGCRFYPRCSSRMDRCLEAQPPLYKIDEVDHEAACYLYSDKEEAVAATY
ncbi:MAG: ABC transporter ATP-binding protein [Chloroflexota bacterium]